MVKYFCRVCPPPMPARWDLVLLRPGQLQPLDRRQQLRLDQLEPLLDGHHQEADGRPQLRAHLPGLPSRKGQHSGGKCTNTLIDIVTCEALRYLSTSDNFVANTTSSNSTRLIPGIDCRLQKISIGNA